MSDKTSGLEESMARLEGIVSELEDGDHTLEDSLKKFEEGLKLGKKCRDILDKAEMRVKTLVDVDDEGNAVEGDFPGDG